MNNDNILLTKWRNDENPETQKPAHRNPCSMMELRASHISLSSSVSCQATMSCRSEGTSSDRLLIKIKTSQPNASAWLLLARCPHPKKRKKNQKKVTAKNSNLLLTQIIYGCRPATIKTTPRSATNADVRWKPATQLINTMWAGWTSMSRKTLCAAGWLKTLYGRALGNSQNLLYIQH